MHTMLRRPPAMAYIMALTPPNISPDSTTFSSISTKAVGMPSI